MRILIATDVWRPLVNGIVRTLGAVAEELTALGHDVTIYDGGDAFAVAMPGYPEARLAFPGRRSIAALFERVRPDAVYIATEGPVGHAVRRYCRAHRMPFTTGYHSRLPQFASARLPFPGVERAF